MRGALAPILGLFLLWLAVFLAHTPLTRAAEARASGVVAAAAATYVSLRAIDAALSMAGEVELGASLGVGASVNPLGWLEPVDDTVERVSALVFGVAVLSGVLAIGFGPVASVGLGLVGLGLLAGAACALVPPGGVRDRAGRGASACVLLGVGLAVVLPAVFVASAWVGAMLTGPQAVSAGAVLAEVADRAHALIRIPDMRELNEYRRALGDAAAFFWERADDVLRASVTLAGVYVLQLVVLPAVLLWGAVVALRSAL